ncbi:MAG: tetratricopeptide repeat protein [Candidatus Aegiribacteria sp.]|nr:tetratricopeptide repeat protein [Candidatus Aegiribacteria sp.]
MTDLAVSQDTEALKKKLSGADGLDRVRILADLSVAYRETDRRKAIEFGEQGLKLLEINVDKKLESIILNELCWAYQCIGEYQTALEYGLKNLEITDTTKDEVSRSDTFNRIGIIYYKLSNIDRALDYFLKSLRILEESDEILKVSSLLNNISIIYSNLNDESTALDYCKRAIEISEKHGCLTNLANSLNNAGSIFRRSGKLERALEYYQRTLEIRLDLGEVWKIARVLTNIGMIHDDLNNHEDALNCFFRALEIEEEKGDIHDASQTLLSISLSYASTGKFEEAYEYAGKGLSYMDNIDSPGIRRNVYQSYSEVCEMIGNFREALKFLKKYKTLNDEIYTEDSSRKVNELRVKYESDKKERETEINRLRNIELARTNEDLKSALGEVKHLSGLLPICSSCKKIRDDNGYWEQIESYISDHSEALFSHGLCPECMKKLYPELVANNKSENSCN